ncbi:MAG: serine/threonine-protein kinase [Comamonadaceae bacterium]|nr:MAG: serine/threonine-protein kinase [Comamonadaceae bacterium]
MRTFVSVRLLSLRAGRFNEPMRLPTSYTSLLPYLDMQGNRVPLVRTASPGQAHSLFTAGSLNSITSTKISVKGTQQLYVGAGVRNLLSRAWNYLSGKATQRREAANKLMDQVQSFVDSKGGALSEEALSAIDQAKTEIKDAFRDNQFKTSIRKDQAEALLKPISQMLVQQDLRPLNVWFSKQAPDFFDRLEPEAGKRDSGLTVTKDEIDACRKMVAAAGANPWTALSPDDFDQVQSFASKWLDSAGGHAPANESPSFRLAATIWAQAIAGSGGQAPAAGAGAARTVGTLKSKKDMSSVVIGGKAYARPEELAKSLQVVVTSYQTEANEKIVLKQIKDIGDEKAGSNTLHEAAVHAQACGSEPGATPNILGFKGLVKAGKDRLLALAHAPNGDALGLISKLSKHTDPDFSTERSVNARLLAFTDMAKGVQQAHANGVMHLDLKHENFFVDSECNLVLGDFGTSQSGLARFMTSPTETPEFSAPELRPNGATERMITYKADMWSLGVLLYQMFSPRAGSGSTDNELRDTTLPFLNSTQSNTDVYNNIAAFGAMPLSDRYAELGLTQKNPLHDLIVQLLDPKPENRLTADELLAKPLIARFVNPASNEPAVLKAREDLRMVLA